MASSDTEGHIKKLRSAGYLSSDIAHRLPDEGELIPTPRPHERVVFLSHFFRGLGFPLHPFVRGLMFYYGLDFHDLAPNFILNISAFIVVCEAFLCIQPHFGLWLKTFSVKPKVVKGSQAECRGVRTPILSHTDLACNTSYHFAASRTVFPRVPPHLARDRLRILAHVYDSAASIHMTKNPG